MPMKEIEKKQVGFLTLSIAESHFARLGVFRTCLGALNMYWSIPVWVILHMTTATFLYQKIIVKIFKLPKVEWKNHVILDRHLIEGLNFMDKVNCLFCGYANGLTTMVNKEIDHLSRFEEELSFKEYLLALFSAFFFIPVIFFSEIIGIQIVYNILVAPPLGMHKVSFFETDQDLKKSGYAEQFSPFPRSIILFAKNTFLRFSFLLEQIESSWCPLKHLDKREEVIYPEHHRNFFRPDELNKMREVLLSKGTVSEKIPLY